MAENSIATVWLDRIVEHIDDKTNSAAAIYQSLCKIDPYLLTFRDSNKCIDYIMNMKIDDSKVLLIISSSTPFSCSDTLLQQMTEVLQIDSIYILYPNTIIVEPVQFSTKVHEVYTDVTLLSNTLSKLLSTQRQRRRRNDFLHDAFTISSFSTIDSFTRSETAFTTSKVPFSTSSDNTNNTKRQEAEFMYSQFLQGILIEISSTQEELIKFCRTKYDGDESQLNYIEQFEDYYIPSSAVYWYTRDTFLYRLLNKALREYDIDTLYPLRYYIKDLHSQLKEKHASQQQLLKIIAILCDTSDRTVAIVYRGQLMANVEFDEKILQKKGGFFSVSSFLSTTCVKHLASIYAGEDGGSGVDSNSQRILFEIVIDKSVNKFPYANISADSAFDENENEILFTMGAVFRILSICQNGEGIWMVQLKLTGEEDKELRTLTEYMRNDIINCYPLISLAQLMEVMGYHSKAAQFYRSLLGDQKIKEDYNALSNVHNNLGLMYRHMGKELDAIKHYEKSLEIILPHSSSKDPRAAVTYNNLGTIYLQQNDFDKALSYFKKALAIYSSATILKPSVAVKTINNIGMCYYEQREYQKALDMYLEALGIQFNNLPHNHPDIATTYNNISIVYNDLKDYKNAVEYMKKALQIESISLSSDHSSLSRIYSNLSDALFKDGKFNEALQYMKKKHEIDLKNSPTDHNTLNNNLVRLACIELCSQQKKEDTAALVSLIDKMLFQN